MFDSSRIHEGMVVRSPSGKKVGKVSAISGDAFEIESGLIVKERCVARVDDVEEERAGELILAEGEFVEGSGEYRHVERREGGPPGEGGSPYAGGPAERREPPE